ncbi:MAG: hypothetical protein PUF79_06130 [Lactobacillaceae bacterium]|nr:hypothetical protein [Lactobacillaceae bacterium]
MNNQPTAPQDDRSADEPFLSRQQYRQQQEKQRRRPEPDQDDQLNPEPEDAELHRRTFADERASQDQEEKVSRLKRRLNIAIVVLVVAIIIVYLILFYVG